MSFEIAPSPVLCVRVRPAASGVSHLSS